MKIFEIFSQINQFNILIVIVFSVLLDVGLSQEEGEMKTIDNQEDNAEEDSMDMRAKANIIDSPMSIIQIIMQAVNSIQTNGQGGSAQPINPSSNSDTNTPAEDRETGCPKN